MCWVMPPASPATTLVERMRSSSSVLPWSTWPMTVTTGGRGRRSASSLLLVLVLEVLGLELGLLLLAGVDEADVGAELGGEQLDHVVAQRLGGGDHLALEEQEPDDVAGRAVELGPELAGRRAPLDDDLDVGHRRVRRRVGGELRRLELLEVATPAPGPPLGRSPATGGHRPGRPGATADRATAAGRPPKPPPPPGRPPKPPPPPGRPGPPPPDGAGRPPERCG